MENNIYLKIFFNYFRYLIKNIKYIVCISFILYIKLEIFIINSFINFFDFQISSNKFIIIFFQVIY